MATADRVEAVMRIVRAARRSHFRLISGRRGGLTLIGPANGSAPADDLLAARNEVDVGSLRTAKSISLQNSYRGTDTL